MNLLVVLLSLAVALASGSTLRPIEEEVPEPEQDQESEPDSESELEPQHIITNGYTAPEDKAPYIVFLAFRKGNSGSWCGGSIIGNTWVVTASHCSKTFTSVTVYYGSNRRQQGTVVTTVSGNNIINHPSDDIALIRTPHINFTNRINRVKLPSFSARGNTYVNQGVTACGWGQTTSTSTPQSLQCLDSTVIDNAQCARTYGSRLIQNQILCIGTAGGKSICYGDSGGPLVTRSDTTLIGVSQFVSSRGCTSGDPAGFARVTSHLEWIRGHTGISY